MLYMSKLRLPTLYTIGLEFFAFTQVLPVLFELHNTAKSLSQDTSPIIITLSTSLSVHSFSYCSISSATVKSG